MRSSSRSSFILLSGGGRACSLTSLTRTFLSPVGASTYHNWPCSPESSRCANEIFLLSGLHLIVSGARPVIPPSAKIPSIVSFLAVCCGADWLRARALVNKTEKISSVVRFTSGYDMLILLGNQVRRL